MESVQREYIFLRRKRSCTSSRSDSSSDGGGFGGNTNKSDIFTITCKRAVRLNVLAAVLTRIPIFWGIMLCCWLISC